MYEFRDERRLYQRCLCVKWATTVHALIGHWAKLEYATFVDVEAEHDAELLNGSCLKTRFAAVGDVFPRGRSTVDI